MDGKTEGSFSLATMEVWSSSASEEEEEERSTAGFVLEDKTCHNNYNNNNNNNNNNLCREVKQGEIRHHDKYAGIDIRDSWRRSLKMFGVDLVCWLECLCGLCCQRALIRNHLQNVLRSASCGVISLRVMQ